MLNLETIVDQVGAESAAVMFPHETEPCLYCKENINMPPEWVEIKNPLDNTTSNGKVYLSGEPHIAEHIDLEFVSHFISSVLIVPIQKDNKVLATLELIISDPAKSFNRNAQSDATKFATELAYQL